MKFGAIVTDGRGKIGGHVASKNRSGAYLRTKTTPVNPQTTFQAAVRASFATFSQAWSALSATLILAWNNAVADWATTDIFGDLRNPTGKNLFLRLNQQAVQAGYSSFTAVPAKQEMVEGIITSSAINLTSGELTPVGFYEGSDARVVLFATPVLSAGTSFVKNKLRQIYSEVGINYDAAASYTAYVSRFGTPTAGDNIKLGVKYVLSNGQASPMQVVSLEVVA